MVAYPSFRMVQTFPNEKIIRNIIVVIMPIMTAIMIYSFIRADAHSIPIARALTSLSYTFMLVLVYLFILFLCIDFIRLLLSRSVENMVMLRQVLFALGSLIIIIVLLIGNHRFNNPQVVELELASNKEKQGKKIRLVAASDLHLGADMSRARLKQYVDLINAQNPDLVLFAGDIIDRGLEPVISQGLGKEFLGIEAEVIAISGNHDYYGSGKEKNFEYLEKHGVKMLLDEVKFWDEGLYILGREDRANSQRLDLGEILENTNPSIPIILLDHQPFDLNEAKSHNIDLQISGHTHYGQFWPINLIEKLIFELPYGYKQKDNTHYYVSSGLGIWGPKYRIGTRSEIVVIDFEY